MTDDNRHLRAVHALVARAPLYRTISAPTALAGGLLSLGGFATAYYAKHHRHHPLSLGEFLIVWLVILGLTALKGFVFLWRGSVRQGEPFFSPGMRCALLSLTPTFLAAVVLTFLIRHPIQLASAWLIVYGMALLATHFFAPRSLVVLGGLFFATGFGLLATWKHFFIPPDHTEPSTLVVSGILAATFGGYHLAYAAVVWALGAEPAKETAGAA